MATTYYHERIFFFSLLFNLLSLLGESSRGQIDNLHYSKYSGKYMANISVVQFDVLGGKYYHNKILGWTVAVLLTNVFGTFANVVMLFALIKHRPLRQSSSCALISHCVVLDLYMTAVTVPASAIPFYLGPNWPFPVNFCKYQPLVIYSVYTASLFASSILALHRMLATILPRHFAKLTTKSFMVCMIIVPWIGAFLLNIFPTLEIGTKLVLNTGQGNFTGICHLVLTGSSSTPVIISSLFGIYLPAITMGVCYVTFLIKTALDKRRKQTSLQMRRRVEISRTLLLSFLWHCTTVFPTIVFLTFYRRRYVSDVDLRLALGWLSSSFSAINPVFLFGSSRLFQDGVGKVLWRNRFSPSVASATRTVQPLQLKIIPED